jgi:cytochrome c553
MRLGFLLRALAPFAGFITLVYASASAAADAPAKPDLERGRQLATTVCAACHGADGRSTVPPSNPNLAGQHAGYIAAQLEAFKSGARPSPIMQGMAAALTPEDMQAVGAYYATQKPVESLARDKALAQRGEKMWRGGVKGVNVPACAGCHGAAGHGIPAQYPRLAGQHPDLVTGWLKAYASGARPSAVMGPVAAKLTENDTRALAEYISGLR